MVVVICSLLGERIVVAGDQGQDTDPLDDYRSPACLFSNLLGSTLLASALRLSYVGFVSTASHVEPLVRIGSITHLLVGSQRAVSPDWPGHLPSAGRFRSPISVQIGVRPPNSSQRRPRRTAFPLPTCFPASRRHGRAADGTARTKSSWGCCCCRRKTAAICRGPVTPRGPVGA